MPSIRARLDALEHYRRAKKTGGVAFVLPADNEAWRAEFAGKTNTFPTQAQALHYIRAQTERDIPVIIFDI